MKLLRYLFLFEGWFINIGVGIFCIAMPNYFAANFTSEAFPDIATEFLRWYGVLLMVLGYFELRALYSKNTEALKFAIEALLFGDLLHFGASILFMRTGVEFSAAVFFMFFMTTLLALTRTWWLIKN